MFLVIANWKMNGSAALAQQFSTCLRMGNKVETVICPPYHLISSISGNAKRGAQNCYWELGGAHTGEVSAAMLKDIGTEFVILGHSERREDGETSQLVAKKAIAAQKVGLRVVLCIGEKEGEDFEFAINKQIRESIPAQRSNIIIAYEPVWAIGSGRTPTIAQISAAHNFIKRQSGLNVIYGGSVKADNAREIAHADGVSGLLVGGASLDINSFNAIIGAV